jgi:hypothetical protein
MANDFPPSFRVCKLYEKTSKSGSRYFTGRWGGAKVALLKTNETGDGGDPVWALVLSEAPQQKPDERASAQSVPAPLSPATGRYVEQTLPDDSIPFAPEWR